MEKNIALTQKASDHIVSVTPKKKEFTHQNKKHWDKFVRIMGTDVTTSPRYLYSQERYIWADHMKEEQSGKDLPDLKGCVFSSRWAWICGAQIFYFKDIYCNDNTNESGKFCFIGLGWKLIPVYRITNSRLELYSGYLHIPDSIGSLISNEEYKESFKDYRNYVLYDSSFDRNSEDEKRKMGEVFTYEKKVRKQVEEKKKIRREAKRQKHCISDEKGCNGEDDDKNDGNNDEDDDDSEDDDSEEEDNEPPNPFVIFM